jgi:tetrahydromethanopterin S-methyltransferase subunit B
VLGDYVIISFVIENPNNGSITWMSTNRIGDITQIIEIELESYESKIIWYRIIPHIAREYDVWIDGQTGTFRVISTEIIITDPLEELNLRIDYLDTTLQNLTTEFFLLQTDYNADVEELNSKIDALEATLETYSNEVNEEIEYLENKISSLQSTILFAYIAIAVSVIGGFYFIKRMR